jgi:hypothetical protein
LTEIADILRRVWELRVKMLLAVVAGMLAAVLSLYHVRFLPPELTDKGEARGTASTQVLVDYRRSALGNAAEVRRLITQGTGISPERLNIQTPGEGAARALTTGPPSADLAARRKGVDFNLEVAVSEGLPLMTFIAKAPDPPSAEVLANQAAQATVQFLERRAASQPPRPVEPSPGTEAARVSRALEIEYRQLRPAQGVPARAATRPVRAVLLGFVVAVGVGVLIMLIAGLYDELRALRARIPRHEPEPH